MLKFVTPNPSSRPL